MRGKGGEGGATMFLISEKRLACLRSKSDLRAQIAALCAAVPAALALPPLAPREPPSPSSSSSISASPDARCSA